MPNPPTPLQPEKYYHIYNRGINGCPIFTEPSNYQHFLMLYDKYISPVAETYAWVLMGNHFHLLVKIRDADKILSNIEDFENIRSLKVEKRINQQFSNLFNAYSKAFNKKYQRTGSLFEHPFRRKLINSEAYLKRVLIYIHNNPVHHGFCESPIEYGWSSYLTCVSDKETQLKREELRSWFDDLDHFKQQHLKHNTDINLIDWFKN
jgi:REP element-mobilizing transposase RayT